MDSKKSNKIRDIVRLQQILKKWRNLANSSKTSAAASAAVSASKSIKFLKRTLSSGGEAAGNVVPKGYLAVSVGWEQKRFVIPTQLLSHPAIQILLREAEEEFGFQQSGVLRLPCEVALFENVLKVVEKKKNGRCGGGEDEGSGGYWSSESVPLTPSHHPQRPLCR